jgi:tRNA pseudouridine38-40 synthase
MSSYRVTIAYDGTDFVGWQRQASGVSVQGVLEEALRALDERHVTAIAAGRTDAGVHALGQVAAFTLAHAQPAETVLRALNARLPETVRVLDAAEVPASFHPQFDAHSKTYRYRIWNGDVLSPFERRYAWHLPGALDVGAMRAAAALLEGEHDFAAFQGSGSDVVTTVRRVLTSRIADCGLRIGASGLRIGASGLRIGASGFEFGASGFDSGASGLGFGRTAQPALVEYEIAGTGFLRHMVRVIVGSLVEVGRRRQPPEWLTRVLDSRDRSAAGQTAPALGLFLVGVDYGAVLATDA